MSGRSHPTGVNSPSAANAAHAWRLSTVTGSGRRSLLTARNSAAAIVAAATEAVARPVTSNGDGSTARGPVTVSSPGRSAGPPTSPQIRAAMSLSPAVSSVCVMTPILVPASTDNQR